MSVPPKHPSGAGRKHGRLVSQPMLRRSTKGPLDDIDDPLSDSTPSSPPIASAAVVSPSNVATSESDPELVAGVVRLPEVGDPIETRLLAEVGFLRDPTNYHALSAEDVAPIFLQASNQPVADTPLETLLRDGHYRRAAGAAVIELVKSNYDLDRLLHLFYVRLGCLVLISRPELALQEGIRLTDYLNQHTSEAKHLASIIPWELRLLLVRLQSIATADGGRRGVLSLYALASEVRGEIREAQSKRDTASIGTLTARLHDLGLKVADAFVEMGELETATKHLDSLDFVEANDVLYRKALIRIRVGDAGSAARYAKDVSDKLQKDTLLALLQNVNGDHDTATKMWKSLADAHPTNELFSNNCAISMLYTGNLVGARQMLEDLAVQSSAFPALLFNLGTIYDLCTAQPIDHKMKLLQTMAAKAPTPASGGWERANFEIKV